MAKTKTDGGYPKDTIDDYGIEDPFPKKTKHENSNNNRNKHSPPRENKSANNKTDIKNKSIFKIFLCNLFGAIDHDFHVFSYITATVDGRQV